MSCAVVCPSSSVYQPTNIIGYHCIELNVTTVPSKKCNEKNRYCNNIPENDGDCDNDADCHGELICGSDNCEQTSGTYAISDDCCMQGTAEAVAEKKKNTPNDTPNRLQCRLCLEVNRKFAFGRVSEHKTATPQVQSTRLVLWWKRNDLK